MCTQNVGKVPSNEFFPLMGFAACVIRDADRCLFSIRKITCKKNRNMGDLKNILIVFMNHLSKSFMSQIY